MTTGKVAALKRADRALAGAALILLLGGSAPLGFNLYTNEFRASASASRPAVSPLISPDEARAQTQAREHECLAQVMYYEARGEGEAGEKAVAEVVLERKRSRYYPRTICGVVQEGAELPGKHCQFSFACDGSLNRAKDRAAWNRAQALAGEILDGGVKLRGDTLHAIAYHSADVNPRWADTMLKTTQIGNHIFYRRMPLSRVRFTVEASVKEIPIAPIHVKYLWPDAFASQEIQPDIQISGAMGNGT